MNIFRTKASEVNSLSNILLLIAAVGIVIALFAMALVQSNKDHKTAAEDQHNVTQTTMSDCGAKSK